MKKSKQTRHKNRIGIGIVSACLAFFVFAQPAHAILGIGDISITAGDIPRTIEKIVGNIVQKFGSRAFYQALRSVTYQLAQDTAVWVASGDRGKKPLIFTDFKKGLSSVGDEVAGKFLVNLSSFDGGIPVNLCSSESLKKRSALVIGVSKSVRDFDIFADTQFADINNDIGQRGCSLSKISDNVTEAAKYYKESAEATAQSLKNLQSGFDTGKTDISTFLVLQEYASKEKADTKLQVQLDASKGVVEGKDAVGNVKNAAEDVKRVQDQITEKAINPNPAQVTGDIFVDAFQIFTNTLAQTYLQRLSSGFYPLRKTASPDSFVSRIGGEGSSSRRALLASFSEFSPENVLDVGSPGEIDLFSEMASCPPGNLQSPYHCLLSRGLQQAVQEGITVRQALERGLLDPNMLFPQEHDNTQPVLSIENIRKLRFLRVVPLGWEIAAERAYERGQVRLGTVVQCFEDSQSPNDPQAPASCVTSTQNPDAENPYYHLIDPTWLLDIPQQFCRAQGYGNIPEHERSPNRTQACVDLQSCIETDAQGNCVAYGYCTRERNTWQLSGEQCEEQYATCTTFTASDNSTLSLLTNSLNTEGCTLQNAAGCQWYSRLRNPNESASDRSDDWYDFPSNRIYLNSRSQSCGVNQKGSEEIIPFTQGINLVKNGDFSEDLFTKRVPASENTVAYPTYDDGGWKFTALNNSGRTIDSGTDPFYLYHDTRYGLEAIKPDLAEQIVHLKPRTYYTLSFDVQSLDENTVADVRVQMARLEQIRNVSFQGVAGSDTAYDTSIESTTLALRIANVPSSEPVRYAATFYNTARSVSTVNIELRGNLLYDNIQLEPISLAEGIRAKDQVDAFLQTTTGAVASLEAKQEYVNTVPSNAKNIASPTTPYGSYNDNQKNKRVVFAEADSCTDVEASAVRYTRARDGKQTIARLTPNGLCAQQCNGMNQFLAIPTPIEKLVDQSAVAHRAYFIPSRAQSCQAQDVGCEVFTNTSSGTEQREYYSKIESCVADTNPNTATFFTWEGTDTAGFQLRAWQFLAEEPESSTDTQLGPCAAFPQGLRQQGGISPENAQCQGVQVCSLNPADENYSSTCRTYLDVNGVEYTRDSTRLVTASNECTTYRRTNTVNGVQEQWYFIPNEANTCRPTAIGCREYKGALGNVTQTIFNTTFENNVTDQWSNGTLSPEAIVAGESSLRISGGTDVSRPVTLVNPVGKSYLLRFNAKAENTNGVLNLIRFGVTANGTQLDRSFIDASTDAPLALTTDWRSYTVGPVLYESLGGEYDTQNPRIIIRAQNGNVFIDDIELVEVQDRFYVTDQSTRAQENGGTQPNGCYTQNSNYTNPVYARCEAYTDSARNTYFVETFDQLFSEEALSCTAAIVTNNYTYPYSERFFQKNSVAAAPELPIDVRADRLEYRRLVAQNVVVPQAAGCTEVGLQKTDLSGTYWQTTYRTIDPDTFGQTLCQDASVGCGSFTTTEGAQYTFRDPRQNGNMCEWSAEARGGLGGWVKQGSDDPCETNDARTCPSDQNACTAYAAYNDAANIGLSDTLFYRSNTLTSGDCQSEDIGLGCVSFVERYADDGALKGSVLPGQEPGIRVLQGTQQRQCTEWLAPTTTSTIDDPRTRSKRVVSYDIGRCQKLSPTGECVTWVEPLDGSGVYPAAYLADDNQTPTRFSVSAYQNRYTSVTGNPQTLFSGAWEYTGYSSAEQYPADVLQQFNGDNPVLGVSRGGTYRCPAGQCNATTLYATGSSFGTANLVGMYAVIEDTDLAGEIREIVGNNPGQLFISPDFPFSTDPEGAAFRIVDGSAIECRAYPEEDAPFDRGGIRERAAYTDIVDFTGNAALQNLTLCEESGKACSCSYKKVQTDTETVYLSKQTTKQLPEDTRSVTDFDGWQGYCYEYDYETLDPNGNPVCLSWWPVDVPVGVTNIFDNHPSAGFVSSQPLYYCLDAQSNLRQSIPNVTFVEAKNNTYVLALENATGNSVDAFKAHFNTGTGWVRRDATNPKDGYHLLQRLADTDGPENASGIMQFSVKPDSFFSTLKEYDIDSIVLKVRNSEHQREWPGAGEEFALSRKGLAMSLLTNPEIADENRWTVLWCGGKEDAKCSFGDVYSWDKFKPFLEHTNEIVAPNAEHPADNDLCWGQAEVNGQNISIDANGGTNIFGIRAIFTDENGNAPAGSTYATVTTQEPHSFLGFEGGLCDNTGSGGWVDFEVVFKVREWCSAVAQVDTSGQNEAWSGRLGGKAQVASGLCTLEPGNERAAFCYSNADCAGERTCQLHFEVADTTGFMSGVYQDPTQRFTLQTDAQPFGSIVPPTDTLFDPTQWDSRDDTYLFERLENGSLVQEERTLEPGKQPIYVEIPQGQVRAGTPLACTRGAECLLPPHTNTSAQSDAFTGLSGGITALRNLFTRIFGIWIFNPETVTYEERTSEQLDIGFDYSQDASDAGQCPVIQDIEKTATGDAIVFDPTTANPQNWNPIADSSGRIAGRNCPSPSDDVARAGRYSINGQAVPHLAGVVQQKQQVQVGEEVKLQFYAFNYNGEQLPLRTITIDWGDAGAPTIITGNFKNHRPDCSNLGANYGQTDRACDSNYFEFRHVYRTLGNKWPIVTIEDNWGKRTVAQYAETGEPVLEIYDQSRDIPLEFINVAQPSDAAEFQWVATPNKLVVNSFRVVVTTIGQNGDVSTQPSQTVSVSGGGDAAYEGNIRISKNTDTSIITITVQGCNNENPEQPVCGALYRKSEGNPPRIVDNFRVDSGIETTINKAQGSVVTATWDSLPEAEYYQVEVSKDNGTYVAVRREVRSYAVVYEQHTKTTDIRIRACNAVGCGAPTSIKRVWYTPTAVTGFGHTPTQPYQNTQVTVTWSQNVIADQYIVSYGYNNRSKVEQSVSTPYFTLPVQFGATNAQVRVSACNTNTTHCGSASNEYTIPYTSPQTDWRIAFSAIGDPAGTTGCESQYGQNHICSASEFNSYAFNPVASIDRSTLHIFDTDLQQRIGQKDFAGIKATKEYVVTQNGTYTFSISSDDGSEFWVRRQGQQLLHLDNGGDHGTTGKQGAVTLTPGTYQLEFIGWNNDGGSEFHVNLP